MWVQRDAKTGREGRRRDVKSKKRIESKRNRMMDEQRER